MAEQDVSGFWGNSLLSCHFKPIPQYLPIKLLLQSLPTISTRCNDRSRYLYQQGLIIMFLSPHLQSVYSPFQSPRSSELLREKSLPGDLQVCSACSSQSLFKPFRADYSTDIKFQRVPRHPRNQRFPCVIMSVNSGRIRQRGRLIRMETRGEKGALGSNANSGNRTEDERTTTTPVQSI